MQITGGSGLTTVVKILSNYVQSTEEHPMDATGQPLPLVIQQFISSERRYNGKIGEQHIPAPGYIREAPGGSLVPCANPRCKFAREGRNYCCAACCNSSVRHLYGGPHHSSTCTCFTERSIANGKVCREVIQDCH